LCGRRCQVPRISFRERLIPDIAKAQQVRLRRVGHPALQIGDELGLRHRHRAVELRAMKSAPNVASECDASADRVPQHHDGGLDPMHQR
jgi:hypothetical protein